MFSWKDLDVRRPFLTYFCLQKYPWKWNNRERKLINSIIIIIGIPVYASICSCYHNEPINEGSSNKTWLFFSSKKVSEILKSCFLAGTLLLLQQMKFTSLVPVSPITDRSMSEYEWHISIIRIFFQKLFIYLFILWKICLIYSNSKLYLPRFWKSFFYLFKPK